VAERNTKVTLTAQVAGYVQGFNEAESATKRTAKSAEEAKAKFEEQNRAMEQVGRGLVVFGAAALTAVGIAVAKFTEFDKEMSAVQAATHETAANMDLLRAAAIDAGGATAFSATEAAQAIEELAKAGVSTTNILAGGLKGSLDLAAAGNLTVGEAAETAATAMTQFGIEGSKVPHIADLLAAGAGKAQGSVHDMGEALNQAGLVASQTGLSIEETTGGLAAFASAGLVGSDAGTSFKTMLQSLIPNSEQAGKLMDKLGISAYDSQGNFIGLAKYAGVLQDALKGMSVEQQNAALKTIFGSDAVRAASVLFQQGQDGIQGWIDKVNDSGYAAETAAIMQDNLAGDLEKLGGAFDTAAIKAGAAADGVLRPLVQTITSLVDSFSDAPPIVQSTALTLTALAGAAALTAGAFLLAVPKIAEFKLALDTLSSSGMPAVAAGAEAVRSGVTRSGAALKSVATFLTGPWGLALAAATLGVDLLGKYLDSLQASSSELTNSLKTSTSAADIFKTAAQGKTVAWWKDVGKDLQDLPAVLQASDDQAKNLFTRFDSTHFGAFDALRDIGTQLADLAQTDLPSAQHAFSLLAEETDGSEKQLEQLLNAMPAYKDALTEQATALGQTDDMHSLVKLAQEDAAAAAKETGDAYLEEQDSVQQLTDQLDQLLQSFNDVNGANQDAISSNADYQSALAGISDEVQRQKDAYNEAHGSLDGYSLSIDSNTASGSANASMLSSVAGKAQEAAKAQFQVDSSTMSAKDAADKYIGTLRDQRQKFIDSASAAGFNKDQVQALADKVFALPSSKDIKILTETAQAQQQLDNFITTSSGKVIRIAVVPDVAGARSTVGGLTKADGGVVDYYGSGGINESHFAEIAPAGSWRVWAEPETGGEAYIPLAPSKRQRSLAIWEETGRRLQAFADGGFNVPVMQPAPVYMSMPSVSGSRRGGDTFNLYSLDPEPYAQAVIRRQNVGLV
jgi:TP901 family phage tail tape measure protein